MKKYYICESYNHQDLLNYLFTENENNLLSNIELISLNSFLRKHGFYTELNIFDISKRLKSLPLKRFSSIVDDYDFIQKMIRYCRELEQYQIPFEQLTLDDELKKIIQSIYQNNYIGLSSFIESLDCTQFTIVDAHYNIFQQQVIDQMCDKGAKLLNIHYQPNPKRFTALNKRVEIDLIAETIIRENYNLNECAIVLADKSYATALRVGFERYNIPLQFKFSYQKDLLCGHFAALLDFYLYKDTLHYLKVLNRNIFYQNNTQINQYLKYHRQIIENWEHDFDTWQQQGLKEEYYIKLEQHANDVHKHYQPVMKLLHLDYFSFVQEIYALLAEKYNLKMIKKLKNFIETYVEFFNSDNHNLLINMLQEVPANKENFDYAVSIFQLNQQALFKKHVFVVSCDQKNYPGFKRLDGYFSEESLINTNYPGIQERFKHHFQKLEWLFQRNSFFSYPNTSYNGKNFELSSYLEDVPVIHLHETQYKHIDYLIDQSISPELSQKIFFPNGILKTSVSALELYASCPYYFLLRYGFKLFEEKKLEFNAAFYGTIVHAIMEKLVQDNPKNYFLAKQQDVRRHLVELTQQLQIIYPNRNDIPLILDLISWHISSRLSILANFKDNLIFQPKLFELKIEEKICDDLIIKGIVDRVDYSLNNFRIIDYKTSKHSLEDSKLRKGLQLQLFVYAVILDLISDKQIAGIYYCNLNNSSTRFNQFNYSPRNGFTKLHIDDLKEKLTQQSLLSGKTFTFEGLYRNAAEVGIQFTKSNEPRKNSIVDFKQYKQAVFAILDELKKRIKSGEFELQPVKEKTHYQDYQRITHFRGRYVKAEELIEDWSISDESES